MSHVVINFVLHLISLTLYSQHEALQCISTLSNLQIKRVIAEMRYTKWLLIGTKPN